MTFQLIVDNRVAEKADTLDDAIREAARYLNQPTKPHIEIINLAGGIYRDGQVTELVERLQGLATGEEG